MITASSFFPMIIGLCFFISIVIYPVYVTSNFPKKTTKSLTIKMFLSTLFMIIAIMSALYAKNTTPFAIIMLVGFVFSWIGDLLLGQNDTTKMFIFGGVSFLFAHVAYTFALYMGMKHIFPSLPYFDITTIVFYAVAAILVVVLCITRKGRFHKLLIPALVYASVLLAMFSKASSLGLHLIAENPFAFVLPIGALLFTCSDITLGMLRFKMHPRTFEFRAFCSVTYFIGQMMLATSLLIVKY